MDFLIHEIFFMKFSGGFDFLLKILHMLRFKDKSVCIGSEGTGSAWFHLLGKLFFSSFSKVIGLN
jgi:hypothetical protein